MVILPLLAIGFALVDYAIALFVQNAIRNAVREGVRFAITQQTGSSGQDAAVMSTVEANSVGFLTNTNYISISYLNGTTLLPVTGVGSNAQGNICVVSVSNYPFSWIGPIWRAPDNVSFNASSSDVMEAPPNGILPSR